MAKRTGADPAKDIENIVSAVEQNAERIRTVTFNTVKGQYARRIFNKRLATDENKIGEYKSSTKRIRQSVGRQILNVDLNMTGILQRAIAVGVSEGKTVLGMLESQKEPVISVKDGRLRVTGTSNFSVTDNAIKQEEHFGKEIFAPSESEIKRGEKTIIKEIDLVVKRALK